MIKPTESQARLILNEQWPANDNEKLMEEKIKRLKQKGIIEKSLIEKTMDIVNKIENYTHGAYFSANYFNRLDVYNNVIELIDLIKKIYEEDLKNKTWSKI
jgi:hypothetical protein